MKRLLALILSVVLTAACFIACADPEKKPGYDPSLKCERYENFAVFTFDDFQKGGTTAQFVLERKADGEGAIYYKENLVEGTLGVKYTDGGALNKGLPLSEFSADGKAEVGTGGYVEGNKVTIIFEATGSVTGEVIIAFTEEAFKSAGGELPPHEHTGEWLTSESVHSYEYTCGCVYPEVAELHSDGDGNHICDVCEYVMPEHEHTLEMHQYEAGHDWTYTCGCMTPPNFALHSDGDGDGQCDSCDYDMAEVTVRTETQAGDSGEKTEP